jgi:CRISPR/Cas system-associated exonuclease Cas4 (RecB family)
MIKSWTFSALEGFETCPRKYYKTRVSREFTDTHDANAWGIRAHEAFEQRMKHNVPLPEGMTQWEPLATKLLALPGDKYFEQKLSVNDSFQSCHWKDAWSRGIADMLVINGNTAAVIDYKTGKYRPSEQLRLYAGYTFATWNVTTVKTGYVWLKEKRVTRDEYDREEVPVIWKEFLPRVVRLQRAHDENKWPAKPSGLCAGFCPVKSCEHWKKPR